MRRVKKPVRNRMELDFKEAKTKFETIRDLLRFGMTEFNHRGLFFGHGTENAWDEAVYLLAHALHIPPDIDISIAGAKLTKFERELVLNLFLRRIKERIPAAYLTNEAWFAGYNFYVDNRVLIPRSPIAELIKKQFSPWIEFEKVQRILDIGTGSGCIAIAAAYAFPDAAVDASDISVDALEIAELNVFDHHMQSRIRLFVSDVFSTIPNKKYDIIISNPPYVSVAEINELPMEYQHEPRLALHGGKDGLKIVEKILHGAARYLSPHGILVVEVGNSDILVKKKFANLPLIWLEFENGGGGVFLITAEDLKLL